MKKILVVLAVFLFAVSAFAQEDGSNFKYGLDAWAYGLYAKEAKNQYNYQHIRVRPTFEAGVENFKAVVGLEVDQFYGAGPGGSDPDYAGEGTDNQVVKVKWGYVQANNLFIPNLSVTTGLKDFYLPVVVDNDFALTSVDYKFDMGSFTASYIKLNEGTVQEESSLLGKIKDDREAYIADLTLNLGAINLRQIGRASCRERV